MPINISDENLDALEKAAPEQRVKFFSGLSPEDRQSLATAQTGRKSRTTVSTEQAPGMAGRSPPLIVTTQPEQPEMASNPLNTWAQQNIIPAKDWLQENVGAPIARAGLGALDRGQQMLPEPLKPEFDTRQAQQLLGRQMLSTMGGQGLVDEMPPGRQLAGVNALEGALGTTGAAAAQGIAEQVGQLPLLMLRTPAVAQSEQAAIGLSQTLPVAQYPILGRLGPLLTRSLGAGIEGGLLGAGQQALTKDGNIEEGLTTGAAMGAAIPGVAVALRGVGKGLGKLLGRAEPAALKAMATEVLTLPETPVPRDFVPEMAVPSIDRDGNKIAVLFSMENGKPLIKRIPLETPAQTAYFNRLKNKHGFHVQESNMPIGEMDDEWLARVYDSGEDIAPSTKVLTESNGRLKIHNETETAGVDTGEPVKVSQPARESWEGTVVKNNGDNAVVLNKDGQEVSVPLHHIKPSPQGILVEKPVVRDIAKGREFGNESTANLRMPERAPNITDLPPMELSEADITGVGARPPVPPLEARYPDIEVGGPVTEPLPGKRNAPTSEATANARPLVPEVEANTANIYDIPKALKGRYGEHRVNRPPSDISAVLAKGDNGYEFKNQFIGSFEPSPITTEELQHRELVGQLSQLLKDHAPIEQLDAMMRKMHELQLIVNEQKSSFRNAKTAEENSLLAKYPQSIKGGIKGSQRVDADGNPINLPRPSPNALNQGPVPKALQAGNASSPIQAQQQSQRASPNTITQAIPSGQNARTLAQQAITNITPAPQHPPVNTPPTAPTPPSPPLYQAGDIVYTPGSKGYNYGTGEVVGMLPNGRVQVKVQEIPGQPAVIKQFKPVDIQLSFRQPSAPAQTPPWPVPQPGQLPQSILNQYEAANNIAQKFGGNASMLERLQKELLPPGMRGTDIDQLLVNIRANKNLESTAEDSLRALRKNMGDEKLLGTFDRYINEVVKGNINTNQVKQRFPEQWARIREPLENALRERDALQARFIAAGGNPAQWQNVNAGIADEYAARMYLAKILPKGEWAKYATKSPDNLVQKAVDYLYKETQKAGRIKSPDQIAESIGRMLNSNDPFANFASSDFATLKPFQHLKSIKNLPEPLRNLMGEVNSGIYRLANTLGIQRSVVGQMELMNEVAQNPALWSLGPKGNFKQLPDFAQFGNLRGKYVDPNVHEAVVMLPDAIANSHRFVREIVAMTKENLVPLGGMTPVINDFISNIQHSVLAGGLDVTRPVKSGKAFKDALMAHAAYGKDPNAPGLAEQWREALAYGGVEPGYGRMEIRGSEKRMLDTIIQQTRQGNINSLWDVMGLFRKGASSVRQAKNAASHFYDSWNQWFRMANYMAVRDKLVDGGVAYTEASREAARRVSMSFPSVQNMGNATQKLRQGAVGTVNPFIMPVVEESRIMAQLPGRLKAEPDLKWRMGATALAMAAVFGTLNKLRNLNGTTDEDVEAANNSLSQARGQWRPMTWAASSRDSKGRVNLIDFTNSWIGFQLLRGMPEDAGWRRVLSNMVTMPMSEGAGDATKRMLAYSGLIRQPTQMPMREGEDGLLKLLREANRAGMAGPAAIGRLVDLAEQSGITKDESPFRETLTPTQTVSKAVGMPTNVPVTVPTAEQPRSPSVASAGREDIARLRELAMQLSSAGREGGARTPAIVQEMKMISDRLRTRKDSIEKSKQSHATTTQGR